MWIPIILALILIKSSDETCTSTYTLYYRQLYYHVSCTNLTPNDDLNNEILSKMKPFVKDLLVSNSSIPELTEEMFLNMSFIDVTIKSNVEIIQSEAFKNFNTTSLTLDYNDIKKIKDMSFSSPFIQTLSLQNNSLSEIKVNNFQGLSGLKKLNLKYNTIADIEEDSFNYLTNLEELDLSFNKLVELHFGLFEATTSLQIIYLNNNLLKTLNDHIFSQCKALKKINIENNFITIIDSRGYPSSLLSISASNNQLMSVDFSNLVNVDTINLNFNNLKSLTDSLCNLTSLKHLYLNHNSLGPSIDTKTFHLLKNLTVLSLDGNGLQKTDFIKILNMSHLQILSLAENDLTSLDFPSFNTSLITLTLSTNSLNDIGNLSKVHAKELRKLELSYNNIEEIGYETFGSMTDLRQLLLQSNSIRFLRMGCFRNLYYLERLDLSHNRITNVEVGIFGGLGLLSSLDISYNNLSRLDENIFQSTKYLAVLNISYNHLNTIDVRKIQLYTPWFRHIILVGNNWTCEVLIALKENVHFSHGPFYNVTNVFGIPCTNDENRPANETWDSINYAKYLDSFEEHKKQISWNMMVMAMVLIFLLVLFCLNVTFPKCWFCYTTTRQFLYGRYRNEQEIQLT